MSCGVRNYQLPLQLRVREGSRPAITELKRVSMSLLILVDDISSSKLQRLGLVVVRLAENTRCAEDVSSS